MLPSGKRLHNELENPLIFLVNFPMKNGWIFHSYVSLPEGILLLS